MNNKNGIPFVDLKVQYRSLKEEIDNAISRTIQNARFINGDEVNRFEKEFAAYINVSYCIGVNSGTDALILGIRALGLKPGDEVLIPANTFIATALGVTENGLRPVFVDINPSDGGFDLSDLKKKITNRTKAIIVVHLFGQPDKIEEIQAIIKKSNKKIFLIEDASQSHGAYYQKKRVGSFGIFAAFSFYPSKNLGAYGDAGAIMTDDADLDKQYRLLREYGQHHKYFHQRLGINSHLDDLQAAILRVKLRYLDSWNRQRKEMAEYYTQLFRKSNLPIKTFENDPKRESVYHLYVIKTAERDSLHDYLNQCRIQTQIHYPIPLHLQEAFRYLGYKQGDLPGVEKFAQEILSLPIYPELSKKQVAAVVGEINNFFTHKS